MTGYILKKYSRDGAPPRIIKTRVGRLSAVLGIILNIILGTVKVVLGAMCGLVSVVADGINNLSDCGSCIVSLIGFVYAAKPADREHPFGHGKMEYIASMIVSLFILVVALELISDSIGSIITPRESTYSVITIIALSVSLVVKGAMFLFNIRLAKAVDSVALRATALDSVTDVMATATVLVGIILSRYVGIDVDGYLGIAVAIVIAVEGVKIFCETMKKLLGQTADANTIQEIKNKIASYDGVLGVHDLTVHCYGEGNSYVTAHIEVDAAKSALESHEILDSIERDFAEKEHISLVAHMDPVVLNDPEAAAVKTEVEALIREIDSGFSLHDFRLVHSHPNKLIFEVSVPYENPRPLPEIKDEILKTLALKGMPVVYIVTVERNI